MNEIEHAIANLEDFLVADIGRKYGVSEGMKAEIIIARSLELEEKNVESGADFSECKV